MLPHLVPTIVYGTREDKLPYMRLFHPRRWPSSISIALGWSRLSNPIRWRDDGRLCWRRCSADDRTGGGPARPATRSATAPASTACSTRSSTAVSERLLRYDPAGERDFHDDFGWLDITHGLTYANAARWQLPRRFRDPASADTVRLALWTVFLANWTGRHEWHTAVGEPDESSRGTTDLLAYGQALQRRGVARRRRRRSSCTPTP